MIITGGRHAVSSFTAIMTTPPNELVNNYLYSNVKRFSYSQVGSRMSHSELIHKNLERCGLEIASDRGEDARRQGYDKSERALPLIVAAVGTIRQEVERDRTLYFRHRGAR